MAFWLWLSRVCQSAPNKKRPSQRCAVDCAGGHAPAGTCAGAKACVQKLFDRTCANNRVWLPDARSHSQCAVASVVFKMALYSPRDRPCLHLMRSANIVPASCPPWVAKGHEKSLRIAPSCLASPHRVSTALAEPRAPPSASKNITWHQGSVQRIDKEKLLDQVRFDTYFASCCPCQGE